MGNQSSGGGGGDVITTLVYNSPKAKKDEHYLIYWSGSIENFKIILASLNAASTALVGGYSFMVHLTSAPSLTDLSTLLTINPDMQFYTLGSTKKYYLVSKNATNVTNSDFTLTIGGIPYTCTVTNAALFSEIDATKIAQPCIGIINPELATNLYTPPVSNISTELEFAIFDGFSPFRVIIVKPPVVLPNVFIKENMVYCFGTTTTLLNDVVCALNTAFKFKTAMIVSLSNEWSTPIDGYYVGKYLSILGTQQNVKFDSAPFTDGAKKSIPLYIYDGAQSAEGIVYIAGFYLKLLDSIEVATSLPLAFNVSTGAFTSKSNILGIVSKMGSINCLSIWNGFGGVVVDPQKIGLISTTFTTTNDVEMALKYAQGLPPSLPCALLFKNTSLFSKYDLIQLQTLSPNYNQWMNTNPPIFGFVHQSLSTGEGWLGLEDGSRRILLSIPSEYKADDVAILRYNKFEYNPSKSCEYFDESAFFLESGTVADSCTLVVKPINVPEILPYNTTSLVLCRDATGMDIFEACNLIAKYTPTFNFVYVFTSSKMSPNTLTAFNRVILAKRCNQLNYQFQDAEFSGSYVFTMYPNNYKFEIKTTNLSLTLGMTGASLPALAILSTTMINHSTMTLAPEFNTNLGLIGVPIIPEFIQTGDSVNYPPQVYSTGYEYVYLTNNNQINLEHRWSSFDPRFSIFSFYPEGIDLKINSIFASARSKLPQHGSIFTFYRKTTNTFINSILGNIDDLLSEYIPWGEVVIVCRINKDNLSYEQPKDTLFAVKTFSMGGGWTLVVIKTKKATAFKENENLLITMPSGEQFEFVQTLDSKTLNSRVTFSIQDESSIETIFVPLDFRFYHMNTSLFTEGSSTVFVMPPTPPRDMVNKSSIQNTSVFMNIMSMDELDAFVRYSAGLSNPETAAYAHLVKLVLRDVGGKQECRYMVNFTTWPLNGTQRVYTFATYPQVFLITNQSNLDIGSNGFIINGRSIKFDPNINPTSSHLPIRSLSVADNMNNNIFAINPNTMKCDGNIPIYPTQYFVPNQCLYVVDSIDYYLNGLVLKPMEKEPILTMNWAKLYTDSLPRIVYIGIGDVMTINTIINLFETDGYIYKTTHFVIGPLQFSETNIIDPKASTNPYKPTVNIYTLGIKYPKSFVSIKGALLNDIDVIYNSDVYPMLYTTYTGFKYKKFDITTEPIGSPTDNTPDDTNLLSICLYESNVDRLVAQNKGPCVFSLGLYDIVNYKVNYSTTPNLATTSKNVGLIYKPTISLPKPSVNTTNIPYVLIWDSQLPPPIQSLCASGQENPNNPIIVFSVVAYLGPAIETGGAILTEYKMPVVNRFLYVLSNNTKLYKFVQDTVSDYYLISSTHTLLFTNNYNSNNWYDWRSISTITFPSTKIYDSIWTESNLPMPQINPIILSPRIQQPPLSFTNLPNKPFTSTKTKPLYIGWDYTDITKPPISLLCDIFKTNILVLFATGYYTGKEVYHSKTPIPTFPSIIPVGIPDFAVYFHPPYAHLGNRFGTAFAVMARRASELPHGTGIELEDMTPIKMDGYTRHVAAITINSKQYMFKCIVPDS